MVLPAVLDPWASHAPQYEANIRESAGRLTRNGFNPFRGMALT